MDLGAYCIMGLDYVKEYIDKHYGEIPRARGVRFMAVETPSGGEFPKFDSYCGKDVIYIHTRCGDCGRGFDREDTNYVFCGGKAWEEKLKDLLLEHESDGFDSTYCDHYFKAVVDDEYRNVVRQLREALR